MGGAVTAPENPAREGYKFIGWSMEFNNITEDMIVVARWEADSVSKSFPWREVILLTAAGILLVLSLPFSDIL